MRNPFRFATLMGAASLVLFPLSSIAGFAGTDLFLPMVGRQAGVYPSNWYTTVWIHNPGVAAATARIHFLERNTANPSPPAVDVLVGPGDTEKIVNIVESLFQEQTYGALRVTCATQKLVVTSRVYSKTAGEDDTDSMGQDFAGVPASFAIGAGERTQILGTHQTVPTAGSEFRFNFGFVETTGHSANVRVTAYDDNGTIQDAKDFNVREWSQRQVAFKDHFPAVSTENTRLEVEVISGSGKVIAYGSAVANGSQDPTTFDMTYKDSLLGIATVHHDTTLVGDGTAAAPLGLADGAVTLAKIATTNPPSPAPSAHAATLAFATSKVLTTDGSSLSWQSAADGDVAGVVAGLGLTGGGTGGEITLDVGIADGLARDENAIFIPNGGIIGSHLRDGAVTKGKLSAAGGTAGQVLASNGSALAWADDGLTLPFSGSASVAAPGTVLSLVNLDYGTGLHVVGTHGTAIEAVSANVPAISGRASFGPGVLGVTTTGSAVQGDSENGTGVGGHGAQRGVLGSSPQTGVWGQGKIGVFADGCCASDSIAVWAHSSGGTGVSASATLVGVHGESESGDGVLGESVSAYGVHGYSQTGDGVFGVSDAVGKSGIYGVNANGGWAGFFAGNLHVTGNLSAGGTKPFRIDHPLDPANRELWHAAVESSEVLNVYSGTVVLDAAGQATVELPEWFEALNADVRYQLTCIGAFAPVYIAEKVAGGSFRIAGGTGGLEVSWQLTARRSDPGMRRRGFEVEREKPPAERGSFLDPEAYGQPEEAGVEWVLRPETMRRIREHLAAGEQR